MNSRQTRRLAWRIASLTRPRTSICLAAGSWRAASRLVSTKSMARRWISAVRVVLVKPSERSRDLRIPRLLFVRVFTTEAFIDAIAPNYRTLAGTVPMSNNLRISSSGILIARPSRTNPIFLCRSQARIVASERFNARAASLTVKGFCPICCLRLSKWIDTAQLRRYATLMSCS
jgi:hypothetical protein